MRPVSRSRVMARRTAVQCCLIKVEQLVSDEKSATKRPDEALQLAREPVVIEVTPSDDRIFHVCMMLWTPVRRKSAPMAPILEPMLCQ